MAVDEAHLAGYEQVFDQEPVAELLRSQREVLLRMGGVSRPHRAPFSGTESSSIHAMATHYASDVSKHASPTARFLID
jgi:hypothetical protein